MPEAHSKVKITKSGLEWYRDRAFAESGLVDSLHPTLCLGS